MIKQCNNCDRVSVADREYCFYCDRLVKKYMALPPLPPMPLMLPLTKLPASPPPLPPLPMESCPICYDSFRKQDLVKTPCNHLFCQPCLYKLFETPNLQVKCPICRGSFDDWGFYNNWQSNHPAERKEVDAEDPTWQRAEREYASAQRFRHKCTRAINGAFPRPIRGVWFSPNTSIVVCACNTQNLMRRDDLYHHLHSESHVNFAREFRSTFRF